MMPEERRTAELLRLIEAEYLMVSSGHSYAL
jgi:hypothetical protein